MASSFTNLVRSLPDEALAALLRARPDLIVPVPADLSALAARAQSRTSVTRVIDQLDRFQLEILDALRLVRDQAGAGSLDQLLAVAAAPPGGADPGSVRAAVNQLRDHLLVYGPDQALQLVATVDEVLGPYPAGLGRPAAGLSPAIAKLVADPARLRRTVLSAPPAARAVLERLSAGPPVGATTGDPAADPTADTPATWLVSHGLLVSTAAGSVELPREIGILLRRDTGPLGTLHPLPPQPAGAPLEQATVDQAGAGQAMAAVQRAEAILAALATEPAAVLRSGGLGVRDLRRLARAAGTDEPTTALLVEICYAAGLLGRAEPGQSATEPSFCPTAGYDSWSNAPLAGRWHTLASTWLAMPRQPGLVGGRDPRGRPVNALAPEAGRTGAPIARRHVLGVLADLPAGSAPTAEEVLAMLQWHAPRWAAGRQATIDQLLSEAAALGVTGRAALTSYGAALAATLWQPAEPVDDDPLGTRDGDAPTGAARPAAMLAELLPPPVAELIVQADLTVVVPGPPEPGLAAELELIAEPESAGGASVHRVTRDSLRRALDAGYTAEDLHALFARRARAAVPQALTYLIDDVARAHGGLRIGSAGTYLRSDDEALLAQALADRRLAGLQLRRLAATVLVSPTSRGRLLTALRQAGYAPVPEDASGAPVLVRPRARRAPPPSRTAAAADPLVAGRMSTPRLLGIIEDLRRQEALARAARRAPGLARVNGRSAGETAQAHTEAMAVLQQAVRDKALVWVGYVDAHGARTSRLVRPVSIGAGYLRAEDERTETLHTFALHRITGATPDSAG